MCRISTASGNQGKLEGIFPLKEKSGNLAFFKKIRKKSGNFDDTIFFFIFWWHNIFSWLKGEDYCWVCRSKIPLFLTTESCFIMLSFCMCAFCQYTYWVVSGGHFKKILFIILKCLEKCQKFWKNQGKVKEFRQDQNVETMDHVGGWEIVEMSPNWVDFLWPFVANINTLI